MSSLQFLTGCLGTEVCPGKGKVGGRSEMLEQGAASIQSATTSPPTHSIPVTAPYPQVNPELLPRSQLMEKKAF